jgi:hypothetical protein
MLMGIKLNKPTEREIAFRISDMEAKIRKRDYHSILRGRKRELEWV